MSHNLFHRLTAGRLSHLHPGHVPLHALVVAIDLLPNARPLQEKQVVLLIQLDRLFP